MNELRCAVRALERQPFRYEISTGTNCDPPATVVLFKVFTLQDCCQAMLLLERHRVNAWTRCTCSLESYCSGCARGQAICIFITPLHPKSAIILPCRGPVQPLVTRFPYGMFYYEQ